MRIILCLLAAALPALAAAQTYRWTDQHGRLHFSQLPPPGGQKYDVIGPAPPPAAAPNQDALNQALQESQRAAPEREKAAAADAAKQAQRQEACRAAIERLAYLNARGPQRLASSDEQGSVSRYTQEQFNQERAAEEAKMTQNCD